MIVTEEGYFVDYEVQDFIDHHGVKGQKWGIRQQHQLNKASRKRERQRHAKQVQSARDRYDTSARSNYKKAKAQYKIDKRTKGRASAMRTLQKTKDKNIADFNKGMEYKDGKEVATAIALGAAGAILYTAIAMKKYS
jgi:hypothetical protein